MLTCMMFFIFGSVSSNARTSSSSRRYTGDSDAGKRNGQRMAGTTSCRHLLTLGMRESAYVSRPNWPSPLTLTTRSGTQVASYMSGSTDEAYPLTLFVHISGYNSTMQETAVRGTALSSGISWTGCLEPSLVGTCWCVAAT